VRRSIVVGILVGVSAAASSWRTMPDGRPSGDLVVVDLVPPIQTTVSAQPFVTTGCTGSANGTFGTTSQAGLLGIKMNDLALVDFGPDKTVGGGDDVEVDLLSAPAELNFAAASGANVGTYVSTAVANGDYEAIRVTMDSTFRILCGVTVTNPAACNGAPAGQYLTKGGSSNTSPDGIGGAASTSSLSIGSQSPFNITLQTDTEPGTPGLQPPPIVSVNGGAVTKNLTFSAAGACELWSIGGGNYKVMPASQVAEAKP
jgi:hypothetical protein